MNNSMGISPDKIKHVNGCPFCGNEITTGEIGFTDSVPTSFHAECDACNATFYIHVQTSTYYADDGVNPPIKEIVIHGDRDAIQIWNRRAGEDE